MAGAEARAKESNADEDDTDDRENSAEAEDNNDERSAAEGIEANADGATEVIVVVDAIEEMADSWRGFWKANMIFRKLEGIEVQCADLGVDCSRGGEKKACQWLSDETAELHDSGCK